MGHVFRQRSQAVAVESWLKNDIDLATASKAKVRNIMHVIYAHALRYEWVERNPIDQVRQSGKRSKTPVILELEEIQRLIAALELRERVLVFLDCGTGLRLGELMGLKWEDVNFEAGTLRVHRSVVNQKIGPCKTEASQKKLPLDELLVADLKAWRKETPYAKDGDWVFASAKSKGRLPLWGQPIMRFYIRPALEKAEIAKHIGWHTFRHSYATLLKANGEDVKVVQELMRHASSAITMNLYAQAVTSQKRRAQSKLVQMIAAKPPEAATA